MGFLRKVGRKVNRALGKVFGQKVGSLIGSIGLSMVMWQGAKMLFPGTTGAIETFAENTKNAVFGTPTEAVLEVSKNLDPNLINNNTTPITGGEVSSAGAGTGAGVPDVSGVSGTEAGGNILDSSSISVTAGPSETITVAPRLTPVNTATDAIKKDSLLTTPKVDFTDAIKKEALGDVSFVGKGTGGELLPETLGQKTSNFITGAPEKIKDYVTEGNFVGDVGKGVTTSLIMQEIAGDPEEMFAGGGVAGQPISEAAQGNYMRDVGPSAMAATGMTRMPSFQELSQQTLYGTGSPNFMAQFYQPLATPRMG
tara:strand:- start:2076 stop:3008 length:933 start_codon:yes stop_codon:yes gene_type:complete